MATLKLPVRSDLQSYEFTIELEKRNYLFRFRFNNRMGRWVMDLAKLDGTNVVAGIVVLSNVNLLGRFRSDDKPPGILIAFDQTGKSRSAGLYDLGNDIQLLYQESA